MKRFARALAVTFGIVVLGSFVLLVPQKNAAGAGSAPVTIVNTPLPVTGDVNATLSGNVGINNFPSTQNVSFNGATQPVTFSSTSSNPVFTSDVNAGVFTHDGQKSSNLVTLTTRGFSCGMSCPFMQVAGDGSAVPSACSSSFSFCVPSNRVLVVTDMQWSCEGGHAWKHRHCDSTSLRQHY